MPENQEHRTKPDGRVRIKDTATHMYPNARVYNEGNVRQQIHDDFGYPLIFVEWDKDHWAYSGEQDRWVLEAHFDPVEETMAENPHDGGPDNDLANALIKFLSEYATTDKPSPEEDDGYGPEGAKVDPRPTEELEYDDVLEKATADARDGEAFILIVASHETFQGTDLIMPHVYVDHKRKDAALILEAAIADYVAQSVGRLIQDEVRRGSSGS